MPLQTLPRSYKRKYKKLHDQFVSVQSNTATLQDELSVITETALKLISDNDALLDMLSELTTRQQAISVQEQLTRNYGEDELKAALEEAGLSKTYYDRGNPEHFDSVPWNLDLHSYSGSHFEDFAVLTSSLPAFMPSPAPEVNANNSAARKILKTPVMKKRVRDGEDERNGSVSKKKKKRKSMLDQSNTTWSP